MTNWRDLKPHAINQFPAMQEWEYEELKKSLSKGYDRRMPIFVFKGEEDKVHGIIDGANRHRACLETDTIPLIQEFYGSYEEAMSFILKTNTRRNLSAGQKAAVVLDMDSVVAKLIEEAAKNSLSNLNNSRSHAGMTSGNTDKQLGQMAGVGQSTMEYAKKVKQHDPQLYDYVKSGKISAKSAYSQIQDRIVDGDTELRLQRRAKNILKDAVHKAIEVDKDMLYDTILTELHALNEDQELNFKLKLTRI